MLSAMTETQRKISFLVCLVTIVLAVLDTQIVSAATVPIVRDLDPEHGIEKVPWLVSAFALASAAVLPLYGKLCDTYGAKRIFLGAVGSFLLGSALCGAAQTVEQLIAARAVQGVGAGGLMSVTMVVIAQLKGPGERDAKSAGTAGVVSGAGMALGPWVGGLLAEHAGWRWIFFINLPVALAVLLGAAYALKLPDGVRRGPVDVPGAVLGALFSSGLLLMADWGGKRYGWTSPEMAGLAIGSTTLLALFVHRQRRAADPVLPLSLFRLRALRWGFVYQALMGAGLVCVLYYVMVYVQVERGVSSSVAGLSLLPMALGMAVSGFAAGRLSERGVPERTFVLTGSCTAAAAFLCLSALGPHTSLWWLRAALLLMGLSFGQLLGQSIQLIQDTAPRSQLGTATTTLRFFQTLGTALGAAVFGALPDATTVFVGGAVVMGAGALVALRLPGAGVSQTATARRWGGHRRESVRRRSLL